MINQSKSATSFDSKYTSVLVFSIEEKSCLMNILLNVVGFDHEVAG